MKQFPDEVDPLEFFSKNENYFKDYINFLNANYFSIEALQISYFNFNHIQFYNPCEVIL